MLISRTGRIWTGLLSVAAGFALVGCSTGNGEPAEALNGSASTTAGTAANSAEETGDGCVWAGENPTVDEFQMAFEKYDAEMSEVNVKHGGPDASGLSPSTQYHLDVVRDMPPGAAHAYTVSECKKGDPQGFSEEELAAFPTDYANQLRETGAVNVANPGFFTLNSAVAICALGAETGNPIPGGPDVQQDLVTVVCPQYL